jgi:hypothetical protein
VHSSRATYAFISIEAATISNMWEIASIIDLLERKKLCTKQDPFDIIIELHRNDPRAEIPEAARGAFGIGS